MKAIRIFLSLLVAIALPGLARAQRDEVAVPIQDAVLSPSREAVNLAAGRYLTEVLARETITGNRSPIHSVLERVSAQQDGAATSGFPSADFEADQSDQSALTGERILSGTISRVLRNYDMAIFGAVFAGLPARSAVLNMGSEQIVIQCYVFVSVCTPDTTGAWRVEPVFNSQDPYSYHWALSGFSSSSAPPSEDSASSSSN